MKALSFRFKIAALSCLVSGLVIVGFGVTAYVMISRQKIEGLDAEIRSLGSRHPGWMGGRWNIDRMDESLAMVVGAAGGDSVIMALRNKDGVVLHRSSGWPAVMDPAQLTGTAPGSTTTAASEVSVTDDAGGGYGRGWGGGGQGQGRGMGRGPGRIAMSRAYGFQTVSNAAGEWRVGMLDAAGSTLIIGIHTGSLRSELRQLRNVGLLILLPALLLVAIGGWLISGQALRPIRTIANTAEHVTASGLDQRIPLSHADPEITRVILVLNRMMDRLQSSFQQATRFSADASHELRTPLAIMQGELENAIQEARPGSNEQRVFGNLLEETQRLKTITAGLLMLTRADAGQLAPRLQAVDLSAMLEGLMEDVRMLAESEGYDFKVDVPFGVIVQGDPSLLRTALLNLLVNAVKYNEPGGRVEVTLESRDGKVTIIIGNSGPGIPVSDQPLVFGRFHRVDVARQRKVDGLGLGLSLAREMVRAQGGELVLQGSRPGWTSFMVTMAGA